MSNYAMIGDTRFILGPLEVMQIIAERKGYSDIDIEPLVNGFKATATGKNGPVVVHGGTMHELSATFCARLLDNE